nr:RNA-directed DNA polymerase, eukaryota, reverse transcriptase zinc-binding domain protein [Tanacetum cinerariifolium]
GYDRKNGPKRCSLKIDIQKAYDTVSWSFLEKILHNYVFPSTMIQWIMALNLILKDEIAKERSFKYHFGCKNLKITHLCFADDLLMLCHGDTTSTKTIKRALEKFSKVSGLHPNMSKSIMFCGNLNEEEKSLFLSILPFKIGRLPVRYLGVPLMDKKIGVKDCKSLVDKVRQKLSDWKNNSLSYAGRVSCGAMVSLLEEKPRFPGRRFASQKIRELVLENNIESEEASDGSSKAQDWLWNELWKCSQEDTVLVHKGDSFFFCSRAVAVKHMSGFSIGLVLA